MRLSASLIIFTVALGASINGLSAESSDGIKASTASTTSNTLQPSKKTIDQRIMSFPSNTSIGSLLLTPKARTINAGIQVAGAQGKVKINVPSDQWLVLEPNQRVFLHPELLDGISVDGVDILQLSFLAMNDGEDDLCNKVLDHLGSFQKLTNISLSNSDVTDAGVTKLRSLHDLKVFAAATSQVHGAFLVEHQMPKLAELDLSACRLKPAAYQALHEYPYLKKLYLNNANIGVAELKEIAKCKNLIWLEVMQSPKIDDKALKELQPLRNLQGLRLRGTRVTSAGIAELRGIPLVDCWLPANIQSQFEVTKLHETFPRAKFKTDTKNPRTADLQMIMAPTEKNVRD